MLCGCMLFKIEEQENATFANRALACPEKKALAGKKFSNQHVRRGNSDKDVSGFSWRKPFTILEYKSSKAFISINKEAWTIRKSMEMRET